MARPTLRKVKAALGSLPEQLDRTYDEVLHRIVAQDTDEAVLALKVLGWIHHAVRPLGTRELQHALAVEPGDVRFDEDGVPDIGLVISICAGIVEIRENNTMGLVHYTAQEYLKNVDPWTSSRVLRQKSRELVSHTSHSMNFHRDPHLTMTLFMTEWRRVLYYNTRLAIGFITRATTQK